MVNATHVAYMIADDSIRNKNFSLQMNFFTLFIKKASFYTCLPMRQNKQHFDHIPYLTVAQR